MQIPLLSESGLTCVLMTASKQATALCLYADLDGPGCLEPVPGVWRVIWDCLLLCN